MPHMPQGSMTLAYAVIEGWGTLPPGYRYVEAAGVAVDSRDHVYVFCRGEHPVIVFDREGNCLTIRKFTPEGKLLLSRGARVRRMHRRVHLNGATVLKAFRRAYSTVNR